MKIFLKTYWNTLLFFTLAGLVGGFFIGVYVLDSYPLELKQQLVEEVYSMGLGEVPLSLLMGLLTAVQAAGYGLVLGGIGIVLAKKVGLWNDEVRITKKPLVITMIVAAFGGLALILPDVLFFGQYSEAIVNAYVVKPTVEYILGSIIYGGIIEEVMLRLFMMSLIAFILHKLFGKKDNKPAAVILIISNMIAAFLFAAGHLPTTAITMGLSPMIIFRCFLLNGSFGLMFGWLYRKYGLRYAMIAHGGCHIVSKLIWILFI